MEEKKIIKITPWYIEYANMKFWWLLILSFLVPRLIYLEISKQGIKFKHNRIFDILLAVYLVILIPLLIVNLYFGFVLEIDIQNTFFTTLYTFWTFFAIIFFIITPTIILSRSITINHDNILKYGSLEKLESSQAFRYHFMLDLTYFLWFRNNSVFIITKDNRIYAFLGLDKDKFIESLNQNSV